MTSGDQRNYGAWMKTWYLLVDLLDPEAFGRVFVHDLTNYNN